jgi:mannose-6-phosphate isomerase
MGTHPKAPSTNWKSESPLSKLICENGDSELGENITSKFGNELPFLLKVLSVGRALSIQAHPDRENAKILHANDPAHYPDANHKPEMCIALTKRKG